MKADNKNKTSEGNALHETWDLFFLSFTHIQTVLDSVGWWSTSVRQRLGLKAWIYPESAWISCVAHSTNTVQNLCPLSLFKIYASVWFHLPSKQTNKHIHKQTCAPMHTHKYTQNWPVPHSACTADRVCSGDYCKYKVADLNPPYCPCHILSLHVSLPPTDSQ